MSETTNKDTGAKEENKLPFEIDQGSPFNQDKDQIKQFFELLDHDKYTAYQLFTPRHSDKPGTGHKFIEEPNEAVELCQKNKLKGLNCLGVNERPKEGVTSIEDGMEKINFIVIDIDVSKDVREDGVAPKKYLKEGREVALKVSRELSDLGFNVDYRVFSGNGYHLGLKTDIRIPMYRDSDEWKESPTYRKLETLEEKIKQYETENIEIDTITKDIIRRVKIPGTYNVKSQKVDGEYKPIPKDKWRRAKILKIRENIDVEKNNEAFRNLEAKKHNNHTTASSRTGDPEAPEVGEKEGRPDFKKLLELIRNNKINDKKLLHLYNGEIRKIDKSYHSRSEAEQGLVNKLVFYGYNDEEIHEIMDNSNIGKWKEAHESYKDLTITKARRLVDDQKEWDNYQEEEPPELELEEINEEEAVKEVINEKYEEPIEWDSKKVAWCGKLLKIITKDSYSYVDTNNNSYSRIKPIPWNKTIRKLEDYGYEVDVDKRYFDVNSNGTKEFVPLSLANDIKEDYSFKTMIDTGEVYVFKEGRYEPKGETTIRKEARERLGELQKTHYINETFKAIKDSTTVQRHFFNNQSEKVSVDNGILNLKKYSQKPKEALEPHDPEFLTTKKLPVKYDPEADCPYFKEILESFEISEEVKKTLQEFVGLAIYQDHYLKKALMLKGDRDNGKTLFLNIISDFLNGGDSKNHDNVSGESLSDLTSNRFSPAQLYGSFANICGDISSKDLEDYRTFLELVGGDREFKGERKGKDPFYFKNKAVLMFSANILPEAHEELTDAFFGRWALIEFPATFKPEEEVDPNNSLEKEKIAPEEIMEKVREEHPGILNWALEGLNRVFENHRLTLHQTAEDVRKKWMMEANPVTRFYEKHVVEDDDEFELKDHLYQAYEEYMKEEFSTSQKSTRNHFFRKLYKQLSYERPSVSNVQRKRINEEGSRKRCLTGVGLRRLEELDLELKPSRKEIKEFVNDDRRGNDPDNQKPPKNKEKEKKQDEKKDVQVNNSSNQVKNEKKDSTVNGPSSPSKSKNLMEKSNSETDSISKKDISELPGLPGHFRNKDSNLAKAYSRVCTTLTTRVKMKDERIKELILSDYEDLHISDLWARLRQNNDIVIDGDYVYSKVHKAINELDDLFQDKQKLAWSELKDQYDLNNSHIKVIRKELDSAPDYVVNDVYLKKPDLGGE